MGSGVSPTTFRGTRVLRFFLLEPPEGGDGVGGSRFEDKAAEGDVLSSVVRASTAPLSAIACLTDTGIVDASSSKPGCHEAEARAVWAFPANALSLRLAGEGGGFFHRLTRH